MVGKGHRVNAGLPRSTVESMCAWPSPTATLKMTFPYHIRWHCALPGRILFGQVFDPDEWRCARSPGCPSSPPSGWSPLPLIPCRAPAAPAAGPRRAAESSRSGIRGPVQGVRADAERRGQPASPRDQGDVRHPARCTPSGPPDLARVKNRGRRRRV